jgi:predicted nucleotidyltransferase component of viral defense system
MSRAVKARNVMKALMQMTKASSNLTLNELRVVIALERAVARLESHPRLKEHLAFKGGFVLLKTIETNRFTRDVDALAFEISKEEVPAYVQNALSLDLEDGLWFGDCEVEDLVDQGPYGGLRFSFAYQIGDPPEDSAKLKKLSRCHLDIGFGDEIHENPKQEIMKSILADYKPITWLIYPPETILAEKLETVFSRTSANSRAKDIYDLVLLFKSCSNAHSMKSAIKITFENRKTVIPESFSETAKTFDLIQLRTSWKGVQISQLKPSFSEIWEQFLEQLFRLDSLNI